ncbi:MAG: iron-containing alcohol dehydrogenase [Thermovirgaceae bacterium]|nr:iron-containing alcohol dehydrogenase [Synergistales bacterium]HPC76466.1 iron-containing alcohol dehydrogenase [Synergistales bacterium]HRS48934.1 iron-containing alcohol dehydrogenase [Thermovirgaceae bacterium]HRU91245.1 iron-containing alcohol dehydrogenase [Thermovirgaceae bacterium]
MDYESLLGKVPGHLKNPAEFRTAGVKGKGKLAVGFGLVKTLGEEAAKLGSGKALLVTDKNMVNLGIHRFAVDPLEKAGFTVQVFDEVEPEPHVETCQEVQDLTRKEGFSVVIGLGGGSPMDVAKAASLAPGNPREMIDYMTGTPLEGEGLPCILVPTTSGTGSEVSPYIVTSKGDKKLFIGNPLVYGTVALVDPLLTVTMPPKVTACTGLDALSHGVEGMIGKTNPLTETFTLKCVEYVFQYLQRAVADGNDLEARYHMSFASLFGMMSYTQGGGLYAHSMSYILTIDSGVPHGLGCGLALPYTFMFNLDNIAPILVKMAPLAGVDASGSPKEVGRRVAARFKKLVSDVGIPSSLEELGVPEKEVERFASDMVEKYYRVNNPRPMNPEEGLALVRSMWEGKLVEIKG